MLDVALAQLLHKKLRSLLTVLGFGFCVNLYIVVTTVMRFITEDLDLQVERFRGMLLVQSRGPEGATGMEWPPISSAIDEQEARGVLATPGVHVAESTPVVFAGLAPLYGALWTATGASPFLFGIARFAVCFTVLLPATLFIDGEGNVSKRL